MQSFPEVRRDFVIRDYFDKSNDAIDAICDALRCIAMEGEREEINKERKDAVQLSHPTSFNPKRGTKREGLHPGHSMECNRRKSGSFHSC